MEHELITQYKEQLKQVELALSTTEEGESKENLLTLQSDLKQLIELTDNDKPSTSTAAEPQDEYALFMAEMVKEGAIEENPDVKSLEGSKCRAPHKHTWGDIVYHNALICTVIEDESDDVKVKVMFTNPTHKEMLPCPFFLSGDCKFTEEKCRFSHGEIISFMEIEEYIEPDFENLKQGSSVLVKNGDNLWGRGFIKRLFKEKCWVKMDNSKNDIEVEFSNIFPLNEVSDTVNSESEDDLLDKNDVINMSLMITPGSDKLGHWEQFTKGIGSKLMQKMGYVIGTGLGKKAEGRIEPVSAVVLPPGKSLDHCMELRENAGGDKNLFSVERKLKRLQKKQEKHSQQIYEQESKKVDVFNFLNDTLTGKTKEVPAVLSKSQHRKEIKNETSRNLNVESLKIDESIRDAERDVYKIKESMGRHNSSSKIHKDLVRKLDLKQREIQCLKDKALNIKNEQTIRSDKKKLTIF